MQWVRRLSVGPSPVARAQFEVFRDRLNRALDVDATNQTLTLLANEPSGDWRFIWMLYIAENVWEPGKAFAPFLRVVDDGKLSLVARCWLNRFRGRETKATIDTSSLLDMSYLEVGQALYGA